MSNPICPKCDDEILPTQERFTTVIPFHGKCNQHGECYPKCINIPHEGDGKELREIYEEIANQKGWSAEQRWWTQAKYGGDND